MIDVKEEELFKVRDEKGNLVDAFKVNGLVKRVDRTVNVIKKPVTKKTTTKKTGGK